MSTNNVLDNPHCAEYLRLLRKLHFLMSEGKGDTGEADLVRDAMDQPWRFLNVQELNLVDGLSADLYTLGEGSPVPPSQAAESGSEQLPEELNAAWQQHAWDRVLTLLREHPSGLAPDQVAYWRGRCWTELGDLETALLFLEEAARLNPHNANYPVLVRDTLVQLGREEEAGARNGCQEEVAGERSVARDVRPGDVAGE